VIARGAEREGGERTLAHPRGGERPADDVERAVAGAYCDPLPTPAAAKEVEPLAAELVGEAREDVMVVVAGDGDRRDPRLREPAESRTERARRLVVPVRLVDDVAAQGDDVDALGEGEVDDPGPARGAGDLASVHVLRESGRAPADVHIAAAEDLHGLFARFGRVLRASLGPSKVARPADRGTGDRRYPPSVHLRTSSAPPCIPWVPRRTRRS